MLKIGLLGLGPIGNLHIDNLTSGKVHDCELVCVCDTRKVENPKIAHLPFFDNLDSMLKDGNVDAVILATPSFTHFELAKKVLEAGKHVLVEKPIALCSQDALELDTLSKKVGKICAVMLNQRTTPLYKRIHELVKSGQVGKIRRVSWNITNWFRPQIYFDMSPWRGLWKGEAGGVLINQSIHNIDAFAWILGLPENLRAWCKFGKYHDIEVEDEVTCFMQYPDDMTATFIASSGEHPGTNRFEISGDKMYLVAENDSLKIYKINDGGMTDFTKNTLYAFGTPHTEETIEKFESKGEQHAGVLNNFVQSCLGKCECQYSPNQGYLSLCLANAMLLSSFTNEDVKLPFNDALYKKMLEEKQSKSKSRTNVRRDAILDFSKSFR